MSTERASFKARIRAARAKYRPEVVKCVLIAEAPPDCEATPDCRDRFFYYEDVKRHDDLFLGVMRALYSAEKDEYWASGRNTDRKEALLRRFQGDGFFLLDILDEPKNRNESKTSTKHRLEKAVPQLVEDLKSVAKPDTPIILIKVSTYDVAADKLRRAGFNVIRIRIPFPGQGWQPQFREKFRQALRLAGISVPES